MLCSRRLWRSLMWRPRGRGAHAWKLSKHLWGDSLRMPHLLRLGQRNLGALGWSLSLLGLQEQAHECGRVTCGPSEGNRNCSAVAPSNYLETCLYIDTS